LLAAPGVQSLHPYLPGKPISELEREYGVTDIIKLASNENPLGSSPVALAAMREEIADLALYPDGGGFELKGALADVHQVDPGQITLGNGSNDVLVLLAEAFLQTGQEAVYSQYSFAVYPIAVQAVGAKAVVSPALPAEDEQALGHDLEQMKSLVGADTRLVFIANPNNPTGTWLNGSDLHGFLSDMPAHVLTVVDEAYFEYSRPLGLPDASQWLEEFPGLVVTRTFSKAYGLAGIRVGYSLSSPVVADMMNRVRQPFNVNSLALKGAQAALNDTSFIQRSVAVNSEGVGQLQGGLNALGVHCCPSAANFLLADFGMPAAPIYEALLQKGVIVRPVGNYGLMNHLRITVGTPEQNKVLLAALTDILSQGNSE
jgi:histidinol-phosphate aminotransferase